MSLQAVSVPFRMQPGLTRLDDAQARLTPLDPHSALAHAKRRVIDAGLAVHTVRGFDTAWLEGALQPHLQAIGLGTRARPDTPLALQVEEDLAVLELSTRRVPWMCVCVPSGWAPEEKIGGTLESIHAPVADNALLQKAWPAVAALLARGGSWERQVWTLSPAGTFDQHPRRHPHPGWPPGASPAELAAQCWLRTERQRLLPLQAADGGSAPAQQVLFAIHVAVHPLAEAVEGAGSATRLHDALGSMSPAVLAYKQLLPARDRLLDWLRARAAAQR